MNRATTSKSRKTEANLAELKKTLLDEVATMEEVLPEIILNCDQTGIKIELRSSKIVPCLTWTTEQHGTEGVEMVGVNNTCQITVVLCRSLTSDFFWSR